MKHRLIVLCCTLLTLVPLKALAEDDAKGPESARFYGFSKPVMVESSSPAPQWMLLILLAGVCIAVLFKDAKRTHMD